MHLRIIKAPHTAVGVRRFTADTLPGSSTPAAGCSTRRSPYEHQLYAMVVQMRKVQVQQQMQATLLIWAV